MLLIKQHENNVTWQAAFVLFFTENLMEHSPLLLFVDQNNQLCPQSSQSGAGLTTAAGAHGTITGYKQACFTAF